MARHQSRHRGRTDVRKTIRPLFSADRWAQDLQGRGAIWAAGLFAGFFVAYLGVALGAAAVRGVMHLMGYS